MKNTIPFIISLLILAGCDVFDKPELIPSYIEVDEFILVTTSAEGTNSQKIKDAWVFLDEQFVGAYELPARIPLIANGEHNVQVYPGIYKNGVQAERVIYPFYTYFDSTYTLVPDETVYVTPEISYEDGLNWWIEDFEDPSFKWTLFTTNSDTTMIVAEPSEYPDLFEGNAGLIKMSANNIYCEMRTEEPLFNDLPTQLNSSAYMELNYKCNYPFVLGLLHNNSGLAAYDKRSLITFNPTTDDNGEMQWNKTYLFIPDVTNFFQQATEFDFYISVFNNEAQDNIEVYVDNFKVIF
ncbi:hypothetical protein [Parvicella tangerina]|uniref:hypothetical protein n=1 Tax=Parvicella tangerina TaxID=2829795 RepID=UPI00215CE4E8|nr:hypothetical protein [Parvicella tangerina]